ncbi:hypothetical protein [Arhodomonas sp. SL1]|uniref:hypothetical protein n=1 Tax=Arhodomonas sp. SL1 TaxID=3425691 RepID=UPI003F883FAA
MQALAAFVMRGRLAAIAVTAVAAMMPLLLWLSAAAVALVTLRRGVNEGLLVTVGASVVLGAVSAVSLGSPVPALQAPLQVWLPMVAIAGCLRVTVSLGRTLELAAGLAALAVLLFHLAVGDAGAYWRDMLVRASELFADPAMREALQQQAGDVAAMMTSLWFGNLLFVGVASLLLGRWWQGLLYNPGGFGAEFRGLRFSRAFTVAALVLLVLGGFAGGGLVYDLALVVSTVFLFQALAVAHALVHERGASRVWLVVVYLTLAPFARIYALLGMVDVFVDVRRRVSRPA